MFLSTDETLAASQLELFPTSSVQSSSTNIFCFSLQLEELKASLQTINEQKIRLEEDLQQQAEMVG